MIAFFEAFELLQVDQTLAVIFQSVQVQKINISKAKKLVFINCISDRFLRFTDRKKMESLLKKQIFHREGFSPILNVLFSRAEEMSLEELWNLISREFYSELKEYNYVAYSEYCSRPIQIAENKIVVSCEDSFLTRDHKEYVKAFIVKYFEERLNRSVSVTFQYTKPKRRQKVIQDIPYVTKQDMIARRDKDRSERPIPQKEENGVQKQSSGPGRAASSKTATKEIVKRNTYRRPANDPDVFYGRNCEGNAIAIVDIQDEIGEVVVDAMVLKVETREIKGDKLIVMFSLTDFTDSIMCKIFIGKEQAEETQILEFIKKNNFLRVKGIAAMDSFTKQISIMSVQGMKEIESFERRRKDNCDEKRVELHAHTKMSDMDAVTDCATMVRQAHAWGHKAVAITDHGIVQGFTDAFHALQGMRLDKDDPFKVIYGCEAYLVDDMTAAVNNIDKQTMQDSFILFHLIRTGSSMTKEGIVEISAVKVVEGEVIRRYQTFVNPEVPLPFDLVEKASLSEEEIRSSSKIRDCLPEFMEFCRGSILVGQNVHKFIRWLDEKGKADGISFSGLPFVDLTQLEQLFIPELGRYELVRVCKSLKIQLINPARSYYVVEALLQIWCRLIKSIEGRGIETLGQLQEATECAPEIIRKKPYYHAIMLAKNETGRINLYRLISMSHLNYFYRRPRIPKSVYMKYSEGIILGSACEAGELARAITLDEGNERIQQLCDFYDYFEIQPTGNNNFMLESKKYPYIRTSEHLREINRTIVALGQEYDKPVVATCDVHFLNPEDAVYRRIIQSGMGMNDEQPPLYFRTTQEMLDEFYYLGEEKSREVVITNPNIIADRIEKIEPVYPDKCPPVIPNSDETLRRICEDKAHSLYGEVLPKQVQERLDHELESIINNGFAVMYIIAQKLVWKSNEDGYLVGSRGSVGSSFAATMSGITEVNPLPAHYYCEECHYVDFDSEEVKKYAGSSGCDMPPKNCPDCGRPLIRDGHDIPFETFLGFYGDKEPDIDLNFSGEYQSKAHAYTEVIFGEGQTFRAGTIGTLADKTAFGFVKKFFDEQEETKRNEEIERIINGCVGVRRSTGQHPGGIIVLPFGEEIYTFTPVQHPANDMTTPIITTHFDYHSIDHNLLKLDILGHDDPTMIRMLQDLTGVDPLTIAMDDEKVLSLFADTSSLGVTKEDLMGCDLGSLGIPEFGTEFVMQMLRDTKPKCFSDLVRISGLSHGTDVWLNNAQYYIKNGDCELGTAICTRDDIMTFLIHEGVENGMAFNIMESVRKGKGLTDEWEEAMSAKGVAEWYIESCKKIKYMFPKAHAVAYVMMAFRIAYFKVYYPLAYYAAFFSIRATAFDYELMCQGQTKLEDEMRDYVKRMNELSKKEQDSYKDMKIVQEMYARGFEFEKIDIFRAMAYDFQILDEKLMPALCTIEGMGGKAAEAVEEVAKQGRFTSVEDFKRRTKVSSTTVEKMVEMGLLEGLPMTDQMSIIDFF